MREDCGANVLGCAAVASMFGRCGENVLSEKAPSMSNKFIMHDARSCSFSPSLFSSIELLRQSGSVIAYGIINMQLSISQASLCPD